MFKYTVNREYASNKIALFMLDAIYNRETHRALEIRYEMSQKHLKEDIKNMALMPTPYKHI